MIFSIDYFHFGKCEKLYKYFQTIDVSIIEGYTRYNYET
jgi:hypothetical protein